MKPRPIPIAFGTRCIAGGGRLSGKVTEFNGKLRSRDRMMLKVLVFSDGGDALRFWNGPFIKRFGSATDSVDSDARAWVHATAGDKKFFAVVVYIGAPDLDPVAHEAVHVACRYVERFGFKKSWALTGGGYEIGDFEEQRAYAAGAATDVIWAAVANHAKGET